MPTKYYAIFRGRTTGVFTDWNLVKNLVSGYSNASYKSFSRFEDAEKYSKTGKLVIEENTRMSSVNCNEGQGLDGANNFVEIYTDGSYKNGNGGYGVVIDLKEKGYKFLKGPVPYRPCTNQISELYAIYIALQQYSKENVRIYSDSKYCINVFTIWCKLWDIGGWKRSNGGVIKNSELIKEIRKLIEDNERSVKFSHVKAHSGHSLNEMADTLANEAVDEYFGNN